VIPVWTLSISITGPGETRINMVFFLTGAYSTFKNEVAEHSGGSFTVQEIPGTFEKKG
jgi:hypothetical protein